MADGIGAALTIDQRTLDNLETAQTRITAMSEAADKMAAHFGKALGKADSLATKLNSLKLPEIKIDIKDKDILASLKKVAETAEKLSKMGSFTSKAGKGKSIDPVKAEEDINNRLKETLTKRADTYAAIMQRIKEYQKGIAGLKELGALDGFTLSPTSLNNITEYTNRIAILEERLKKLGAGFDFARAENSVNTALGLDDKNYANALIKMEALKKAKEEIMKPGQVGEAGEAARNLWIEQVAKAMDDLKSKLPDLKKEADAAAKAEADRAREAKKAVKDAAKTAALEAEGKASLAEALGLDENTVEQMKSKATQIENALKKLKKAGLDADSSVEFKNASHQLDLLKNKIVLIEDALHNSSEAATMLGGELRKVVSAAAVFNTLKDMVKTRGDFELIQKSLAVIIKDAPKADMMFREIEKRAVKSPFQVSELATQTKQLAAFRIETDKLLDTAGMLGDISAGIGVDMSRLILALGQVKSATVLKGTELRQFSEAGVNMLGGLADRFTEIQKRAVSTGEVLDMISKKMVSYEDVYAVLQQNTSMGGTFYKMQEQQAETVHGIISNLQDRWEIALNKIGKDSDSVIKAVIKGITWIIENYKVLETLLVAGTIFYTLSGGIALLSKGLIKLTLDINKAGNALKLLKAAFGGEKQGFKGIVAAIGKLGPYIAAVVAVLATVIMLIRKANKETRELKKIQEEGNKEMATSVARYEALNKVINDTTASDKKRRQALEDLKHEYGNILPLQNIELSNLDKLNEAYSENILIIQQYIAQKTQQKQIENVVSNLQDEESKRQRRFIKSFDNMRQNAERMGIPVFSEEEIDALRSHTESKILSGELTTIEDIMTDFFNSLDDYSDEDHGTWLRRFGLYGNESDVNRIKRQFADILKSIQNVQEHSTIDLRFNADAQGFKKQIDEFRKSAEKFGENITEKQRVEYEANPAQKKSDIQDFIDKQKAELVKSIQESDLSDMMKEALMKELNSAYGSISMSPIEKALNDIFKDINKQFDGSSLNFGFGELLKKDEESLDTFVERLRKVQQERQSIFEQWSSDNPNPIKVLEWKAQFGNIGTVVTDLNALEAFFTSINEVIDETRKKQQEEDYLKALEERKAAVKALADEVINAKDQFALLDNEGDLLFKEKLESMAKSAKVSLPVNFDDSKVHAWLDSLKGKLDREDWIELKLTFNQSATEAALEKLAKETESLWEKYDIAINLRDLGISSEGYNVATLIAELQKQEQKYREVNTRESIEAAENIKKRRLELLIKEQDEALKIISRARKEADIASLQAVKNGFSDLDKIKNVNRDSDKTGIVVGQAEINEATTARIRKMYDEIGKAQWESYKSTEMYIAAFGDLENIGVGALQMLKQQLLGFQQGAAESLNPSDVKAIADAIAKIDEEIANAENAGNVFRDISAAFREVKTAKQELDNLPAYKSDMDRAQEEYDKAIKRLHELEADQLNDPQSVSQEQLAAATNKAAEAEKNLNDATGKYLDTIRNVNNAQSKLKKNLEGYTEGYNQVGDALNGVIDLAFGVAEGLGVAFDDDTQEVVKSFQQGFALVGSALGVITAIIPLFTTGLIAADVSAKSLMTTLWPLLLIGAVLGGIMAAIKASDNKKKEQVEEHKKKVEELEDAYEKLNEAMDEALNLDSTSAYYEQQKAAIARMRSELNSAIAAERSRGNKADDDSIEEMQKQLAELDEKEKELEADLKEKLGSKASWADDAKSFTSNWLEAFRETGDGLDSLKKDFQSFFDDMLVQQLNLKIAGPYVEQYQAMLDKMLADHVIDPTESAEYQAWMDKYLPILNEQLKNATERLTGKAEKTDSVETSALQKGIQNITETTGQALEALGNSIRFYVAEIAARALKMESIVSGWTGAESPILNELKTQTAILKSIQTSFSATIRAGHSQGGSGIKVFID